MPPVIMQNQQIAEQLRELAGLLQAQGANPFRVRAYRKAADAVEDCQQPLQEIFERQGRDGLQRLSGVGPGIAATIAEILITGGSSHLQRLRGSVEPEKVFQSVAGIGPALARALHETLHIDTLEALEIAANDGRLEAVPGVGPRRAQMIRAALAALLGRRQGPPRRASAQSEQLSIALLLAVDQEYREGAAAGTLPTIAPKRFNPTGEAWLPVLHTTRDGWHFTALYSNTAQAHRLGRTRDWVVVYFYDRDHVEGQHTIVTETRGTLNGKRVVRGRESECIEHYTGPREMAAG
jgi:predicted flap endonuclease-1-like 5' DNA nuclease